jgi:hypothetical protein
LTSQGPTGDVRDHYIRTSAPSYSFSGRTRARAGDKPKPRTSFMTHSIRGGLVKYIYKQTYIDCFISRIFQFYNLDLIYNFVQ